MSNEWDETKRYAAVDDATQVDPPSEPGGQPTMVNRPGGPPPAPTAATSWQSTDDWADSRAKSAWSGRAEVHTPRPGGIVPTEADWVVGSTRAENDRWWMPILVGVVGLVLLGALGWGIYLIAQNSSSNPAPVPVPSPTGGHASPAQPTVAPATAPAPTAPPTTNPATSAPAPTAVVTIPALAGRSLAEAQAALNAKGLNYRLIYRTAPDAAPGTVISSDPPEGQEVPPDVTVTLVIAAQPAATSSVSAPN